MLRVTIEAMRKHFLVLAAIVLGTLVGCQPPKQIGGEMLQKRYANIVSLSPNTTEVAFMLGLQLKGRTAACNYPKASVSSLPIVCELKPDYEKIAALETQLLIFDRDLFSKAEVEKMKQTKADIFELGGNTVEEFLKDGYRLAAMTGAESTFQDAVDRLNREISVSEAEEINPRPTLAVILPGEGGKHYIAGSKSIQADIVKKIGADIVGPDSEKFEPLSPEFLIEKNPTAILTAGKTAGFLADKRFSGLEAIKNLRIFGLDQDIVVRRGSRMEAFVRDGHRTLVLLMNKGK
jgi:iron complex transport system substrate-binding protein